jgi:hypothetical protein
MPQVAKQIYLELGVATPPMQIRELPRCGLGAYEIRCARRSRQIRSHGKQELTDRSRSELRLEAVDSFRYQYRRLLTCLEASFQRPVSR